jgi:hypothetical protein
MGEIANAKRAGVYLNGENVGYITDVTVHASMAVNEHEVVGDDQKVFTEGVQEASFTFGGLHFDTEKFNYLCPGYPIYDITNDDGSVEPSGVDGVWAEYAIWNTTVGDTPTSDVNPIYDDDSPDETVMAAQAFIAAGESIKTGTGSKVKLNMVGTIAGTLHWRIVNNNSGEPGITVYASGNVTALPSGGTTPEWENLGNVNNALDMTPGEIYWLELYFDDGDANGDSSNYIGWSRGDTDTYYPQLYSKTASGEQTTDKAKTRFATSSDNRGTWTADATYRDQLFLLIFTSSDVHFNIAVRVVDKAGATKTWIILNDCVFNPEDKDFPANDAISSVYTGVAAYGEYKASYP